MKLKHDVTLQHAVNKAPPDRQSYIDWEVRKILPAGTPVTVLGPHPGLITWFDCEAAGEVLILSSEEIENG